MRRQRGSALIISLLILLVMTILGISAMSTATMEEKMASNDRNHKIAFLTAEAGMKEAEIAIAKNNTYQSYLENLANAKPGIYQMGKLKNAKLFDPQEWQSDTNCIATKPMADTTTPSSCYKVEILTEHNMLTAGGYGESDPKSQMIRITTRATDSSGIASALIQTHFEYELTQ